MATSTTTEPFALPPEDAISWFRQKGYRLGFDWRDTWQEEHARAFTVAKAMQLDVLADIRTEVDRALSEGTTFEDFKKRLRPILQEKGWWGEKEMVDPKTGQTRTVKLGSPRRLRIIYDTNLRTSHAAGKWQRIERSARDRPYLRYVPRSGGENRRPEHQALRDIVRPVGDSFWGTYYPPNGWGCKCTVQQLSERELRRRGLKVSPPQRIRYRQWTNTRTGQTMRVPRGVSPGFAYNVGQGRAGRAPESLPVLQPTRRHADYNRPAARDVTDRPVAPRPLETVSKGAGRQQRVRELFRQTFGTSAEQRSVQIQDPTGVQVTFDERILPRHIARTHGRERYLPHAKASVENPYEIWLVPHRKKNGDVTLRRRYIGLFQGREGEDDVLVVTQEDGAFTTYKHDRIDGERIGYLLYARGENIP